MWDRGTLQLFKLISQYKKSLYVRKEGVQLQVIDMYLAVLGADLSPGGKILKDLGVNYEKSVDQGLIYNPRYQPNAKKFASLITGEIRRAKRRKRRGHFWKRVRKYGFVVVFRGVFLDGLKIRITDRQLRKGFRKRIKTFLGNVFGPKKAASAIGAVWCNLTGAVAGRLRKCTNTVTGTVTRLRQKEERQYLGKEFKRWFDQRKRAAKVGLFYGILGPNRVGLPKESNDIWEMCSCGSKMVKNGAFKEVGTLELLLVLVEYWRSRYAFLEETVPNLNENTEKKLDKGKPSKVSKKESAKEVAKEAALREIRVREINIILAGLTDIDGDLEKLDDSEKHSALMAFLERLELKVKSALLETTRARDRSLVERAKRLPKWEREAAEQREASRADAAAKREGRALVGPVKKPAYRRADHNIEEFSEDITKKAVNGGIDPVFGRSSEIERTIHILGRRRKSNPMLLGEPGVGKTAIAEGLALLIARGEVPPIIREKSIVVVDIALLVAGTKYRGEFEARIQALLTAVKNGKINKHETEKGDGSARGRGSVGRKKETGKQVKKGKDMIIVIDEIHTLIGTGSGEGALDAANILKPALARGDLQCIGATTLDEYRKYIQSDKALERRFLPVMVPEPTVEETVGILRGLSEKYAEFHRVVISDEALVAAATLADKYISDRFLPDKAIDLMDEAGSRRNILREKFPEDVKELDRSLRDLMDRKFKAIRAEEYSRAKVISEQVIQCKAALKTQVDEFNGQKTGNLDLHGTTVEVQDVEEIVSLWKRIPIGKLRQSEAEQLLEMESELEKCIIGQEQAVMVVSTALRRARAGLKNPNRPIASFMFAGSTGVGKTELAKVVANYFFGGEDDMIRIDMSELMEKHAITKLIGTAAGYEGYKEGGRLTEAVRRNPYSLVLFDEVEKAHRDVWNLFLQLLEDGRLTDSRARVVDFRNCLIMLTSNVGAQRVLEAVKEQKSVLAVIRERELTMRALTDNGMLPGKQNVKSTVLDTLADQVEFEVNKDGSMKVDQKVFVEYMRTQKPKVIRDSTADYKAVFEKYKDDPLKAFSLRTETEEPEPVFLESGDSVFDLDTVGTETGGQVIPITTAEGEDLNKANDSVSESTDKSISTDEIVLPEIILPEDTWPGIERRWRAIEETGVSSGTYLQCLDLLTYELQRLFSPEVLNRLDEIVVFMPLTKTSIVDICGLMLASLEKRMSQKGIAFAFTEDYRARIIDEGFEQKYGARPLRRSLFRYVEDPLSEELLRGTITYGDTLIFYLKEGKPRFLTCGSLEMPETIKQARKKAVEPFLKSSVSGEMHFAHFSRLMENSTKNAKEIAMYTERFKKEVDFPAFTDYQELKQQFIQELKKTRKFFPARD